MRHYYTPIVFTFVIVFLVLSSYGQKNILQNSIYFETGKFDLTNDSKLVLAHITDSIKTFQTFKIFIKGNTDNIGDSIFNKKLSEQRVLATKQYFISNGMSPNVFSIAAFGEEKPIGDNTTEEGKQKNRRVDISISFIRSNLIDSAKFIPSILKFYKQTERKPQEFCVNPSRDTVLRCEKGTIIYVKANSFGNLSTLQNNCVTLKVKEDFLKSDMILDNLSTTSNGKMIETQGMVYTEAIDYKGNKLRLMKGKELIIMQPTDSINPDAKIFQGNVNPHNGNMNWTLNDNSALSNFSLAQLNTCHDCICGGMLDCSFFFCKIKKFCNKILGRKSTRIPFAVAPPKNMISQCERLAKLYSDYGVNNLQDLITAMNKPLLDSFQVNTMAELQDTLRKINLKNIEVSYLNKTLNYEDLKFYVYKTSRLGWSNVDCFVGVKPQQLVTMKVDLKAAENIDCKLVFKNRRVIISATKDAKKFEFGGIPKGETAWVIAIKYDGGKPFLFFEETTVDKKTVEVDFISLTLEELKEKLKVLDE